MGTLYYGDNLDILRRHLKDETVDLVYLDPRFNSRPELQRLLPRKGRHRRRQPDSRLQGYPPNQECLERDDDFQARKESK